MLRKKEEFIKESNKVERRDPNIGNNKFSKRPANVDIYNHLYEGMERHKQKLEELRKSQQKEIDQKRKSGKSVNVDKFIWEGMDRKLLPLFYIFDTDGDGRITNSDIENVDLQEDLKLLMLPLFEEARLGTIDLDEEEFIDACKNLIRNSKIPQKFSIINKHLLDRGSKSPDLSNASGSIKRSSVKMSGRTTDRGVKKLKLKEKERGDEVVRSDKSVKEASAEMGEQRESERSGKDPVSEHLNVEEEDDGREEERETEERLYRPGSQISERQSEQNVTGDIENGRAGEGEENEEEEQIINEEDELELVDGEEELLMMDGEEEERANYEEGEEQEADGMGNEGSENEEDN